MVVQVIVFGKLRTCANRFRFELELPAGARVVDVLTATGLPDQVDVWALVDGEKAGRDRILSDGCEVVLFQPSGGG